MTENKQSGPTALASWMRGLAKEIEDQGQDAKALFDSVGLDFSALNAPEARYPVEQTTLLWHRAIQATGDDTLGLKAIRHITPATFHAVGLSVMASETLEQAFERMSRFVDLVTDAGEITLLYPDDTHFVVELNIRGGTKPADQSVDGFMALLANAGKGLGDASLLPVRVELKRPTPAERDLDFFQRTFVAPVLFAQSHKRIVYTLTTARTPLKGANALVAQHLDEASQAAIARLKAQGGLANTVLQWVYKEMTRGIPTLEGAAAHMNMSTRNLQRKLAEEGTSLAELLDDARKNLAEKRLKAGLDPITAIALDLGFSDASAFSRACKRWFGKSPSELRPPKSN